MIESMNIQVHPCMSGRSDCLNEKPHSEDTSIVHFWYETGNGIEQIWEVLRMDKNMLANSIGGAAGLFLGYSFNCCLAATLNWICWLMKKFRPNFQTSV